MKITALNRPPNYRRPDSYDLNGDDYSVSLGFVTIFPSSKLKNNPEIKLYLQNQRKWDSQNKFWGHPVLSFQAGWQDPSDPSPLHTVAREAYEETGLSCEWRDSLLQLLITRYTTGDPSLATEIRFNRNGKIHFSFNLLCNVNKSSPEEKAVFSSLVPKRIGCPGFKATRTSPEKERTENLRWYDRSKLPVKNYHVPGGIEVGFDYGDIEYDCLCGHWAWKSSFRHIDHVSNHLQILRALNIKIVLNPVPFHYSLSPLHLKQFQNSTSSSPTPSLLTQSQNSISPVNTIITQSPNPKSPPPSYVIQSPNPSSSPPSYVIQTPPPYVIHTPPSYLIQTPPPSLCQSLHLSPRQFSPSPCPSPSAHSLSPSPCPSPSPSAHSPSAHSLSPSPSPSAHSPSRLSSSLQSNQPLYLPIPLPPPPPQQMV